MSYWKELKYIKKHFWSYIDEDLQSKIAIAQLYANVTVFLLKAKPGVIFLFLDPVAWTVYLAHYKLLPSSFSLHNIDTTHYKVEPYITNLL